MVEASGDANSLVGMHALSEYCFYKLFYGCANLISSPELPDTTLAAFCYESMFEGCTSLLYPADLPATDVPEHCYYSMYKNCTSMKLYRTSTTGYSKVFRIPTTGSVGSQGPN